MFIAAQNGHTECVQAVGANPGQVDLQNRGAFPVLIAANRYAMHGLDSNVHSLHLTGIS